MQEVELAQDDYYYEIQLTNKQLVFYFMAGASGLILSFLAGIMVGRGVDASDGVQAAAPRPAIEDKIIIEEPPAAARAAAAPTKTAPAPGEDMRYSTILEAEKAAPPVPVATLPPTSTRRVTDSTKVPATTRTTTADAPGAFTIQVGAFRDKTYADSQAGTLKKKGYAAYVVSPDGADSLFNVRVGSYQTQASAESVKNQLIGEKLKPFIVKQ